MMKYLLAATLVILLGACEPRSTTPPPITNTPTAAPSDLEAVVRAAIDLGLGRPWSVAGTNYDITEPAKTIVGNYQELALDMLETDLNSSSPTRRANAYDYLDRLFISKRRHLDRAATLVLNHRSNEKDEWVRTLIDLVVADVENQRARSASTTASH